MAQLSIQLGVSGQQGVLAALKGVSSSLTGLAGAPLKAVGSLSHAFGGLMQIAGGVALGGALTNLPGQMVNMATAAAEDAAATARLSQSIRNLGGDFDAQMSQVNAAIAAGQKLAFTDDQIRDSYQFLAVATGSHTEALSRQKIAMDFARGAGIDLATASKLVGKVTAENVQAFKRYGITIAEGASEQEALAAIQKKFAGQAGVFADTDIGRLEQAKIAFSEIKEAIGTGLLPIVGAISKALIANLPAIQSWADAFAKGTAGVIDLLSRKLDPILGEVAAAILTFRGALSGNWAGQTSEDISGLVKAVGNIGLAINAVIPQVQGAVNTIQGIFAGLTKGLDTGEVRLGLMQMLGLDLDEADKVTSIIMGVVDGIRTSLGQVADIVKTALSGDVAGAVTKFLDLWVDGRLDLVETLAGWGKALTEWVAPAIPGILAELQRTIAAVIGWADDKAPEIGARLQSWGEQLWAWVGPAIPPLLAEAQRLFIEVVNWITANGPPLLEKFLSEWLPNAIKWVAQAIPPALAELAKFLNAIEGWLAGPGGQALGAMFREFGLAAIRGFAKGIWELNKWAYGELLKLLQGWANDARDWLGKNAPGIGSAIVDGIKQGIANAWESFKSYLGKQLTDLVTFAKQQLRISSPSAVFAEQVGAPIVEGIAAGIWARASLLHDTLRETLIAALAEAEIALVGLGDQVETAEDVLDGLEAALKPLQKEFDKARAEVDGLKDAISGLQSEMDNLAGGGVLLPGEKEIKENIFGLKNAINILKHERNELIRGGASKDDPAVKAIDARIKANQEELAYQEGKLRAEYDGQRHALEEAAKAGTEVTQSFEQQYERITKIKELLGLLNAETLPAALAAQTLAREEVEKQQAAIEAQKTTVDLLKEDYKNLQEESRKWKKELEKIADEAKKIRDRLREAARLKDDLKGASGTGSATAARVSTMSNIFNIDARGQTNQEVAREIGDNLVTLARRYATSGAL